jgi:tetratricopeptide (TPR) repeat protein
MKRVLILFCLYISVNLIAQETKWDLWTKKYAGQKNYFPEYGHLPKSSEEINADKSFVETITKLGYSKIEGSNQLASKAWDFLRQGDFVSAMLRFNQSWLLDSMNVNTFWGFGTIMGIYGNAEGSIKYLELAYKHDSTKSRLLIDISSSYIIRYDSKKDSTDLNKAIEKLSRYLRSDSRNQEALYKMSICYFYLGNYELAWEYLHKCKDNGGEPIQKGFVKELKDKMEEPIKF